MDYVVGYSFNRALKQHPRVLELLQTARAEHHKTREPQKWFQELNDYRARSWPHARRLIAKAEVSPLGENLRFVLTSLDDDMESLYRERYCARGDMENRIKEQKWLFSDRNSCRDWWPNQFRVLLSGLAYALLERLRGCVIDSGRLRP